MSRSSTAAPATAPQYYTAAQLAAACGVSPRQLRNYVSRDTGGISRARVRVPGMGLRYCAAKAAKLIALSTASQK